MGKTFWRVISPAVVIGIFVLARGIGFAGPSPQAKYVGAKKCKMCHIKQYKTWEATPMAKTYERVAGESDKGKCYKCHTTGYDQPGGFKDAESTPKLKGVQCESCHGPGSEHMAAKPMDKEKKRATIGTSPASCNKCHTPHIPDKAADVRAKE